MRQLAVGPSTSLKKSLKISMVYAAGCRLSGTCDHGAEGVDDPPGRLPFARTVPLSKVEPCETFMRGSRSLDIGTSIVIL